MSRRCYELLTILLVVIDGVIFLTNLSFASGDYVYETKYLPVALDHFNFNDNRTFQLRYLFNDSYWRRENGPIFFYTGNEGNIEMFAKNTGFLWESAKKFKALVVFAEHRFYGESLPFGNLSFSDPKYFGYLSSEQALADFVEIIYHIKSKKWEHSNMSTYMYNHDFNCPCSNPVIAFGGSYGGMLAAWFRMKYPAVVEGALASSAPIWQFTGMTPCTAFNEVLTSAYQITNPNCVGAIKKSWAVITKFSKTNDGRKWINDNWKLCSPLKSETDAPGLKTWLQDAYVDVGMTNYPYATNFLMPLPGYPVKEICSYLTNASLPDEELLKAIFRAVSVYFNGTGAANCLDWSSEPSVNLGETGWNIQSCTEMVMPICSTGDQDMFEPEAWNFQEVSDTCYKNYKVRPLEYIIEKRYGGKCISTASNIIFSNGLLDPWSSGGVLHNISSSAVAVVIAEAAHHLDLRETNPNDPITVQTAREFYKETFKKWIKKYHKKRNAGNILENI